MLFAAFPLKQRIQPSPALLAMSDSSCEPIAPAELGGDIVSKLRMLASRPLAYPSVGGSIALRDAISTFYLRATADDVLACNGADEAILLAFLGTISPGDRIIVQTPTYPALLEIPRRLGAHVETWPAARGAGWRIDLGRLEQQLARGGRCRMIVAASPCNPTGATLSEADLQGLAKIASSSGALVLVDEAHRGRWRTGREAKAATDCDRGWISIGSASKALAAPGLRLGWLVCRSTGLRACLHRAQSYVGTYVNPLAEQIGPALIACRDQILARNERIVAGNLDALRRLGEDSPFRRWTEPDGGTVVLAETLGRTGAAFAAWMEQHGLRFAPGRMFGAGDRFVRLGLGRRSFAVGIERLAGKVGEKD
jgi:hypothetical protein